MSGVQRGSLGRWESGEGWVAGYSAHMQAPGASPVQEVRPATQACRRSWLIRSRARRVLSSMVRVLCMCIGRMRG